MVRLIVDGEKFEILVKPDLALDYKMGKKRDISNILVSDEIYSDANKGTRVSKDKLQKYLNTSDPFEAARIILERGDLNLTAEQRKRLTEEKRKKIVTIISRGFVDPRTHLPHPPLRIEQALEECRVSIDPFKSAEEQAKDIIDKLRKILPLKAENVKIVIIIPPQFAAQSYSVLKSMGELKNEEWQADGSLKAIVEIPAAMQSTLMDKLGNVTKGNVQAKVIR
ncbi:MAG: ribosome assembly factor SBDS [Candidatus Nitrosothermus koennekii]|nr:MAG: ribosome assembly factor SBDS [Candidatus Nitrosothermus koennekii]